MMRGCPKHLPFAKILAAILAAVLPLASSAAFAGMEMASPAPNAGKIIVTLKTMPQRLAAGQPAALLVSITGPEGKPVTGLTLMHERIMHVVITGQDFSTFAHIHPEDFTRLSPEVIKKAKFRLEYTFPRGGRYLIGTDFAVKGRMVSRHFIVQAAGKPEMGPPKADLSLKKRSDGYDITLSPLNGPVTAGKKAYMSYLIYRNGKPVTDMEPYLGALMHIAIISADLKYYAHVHGEMPAYERKMHKIRPPGPMMGMTDMGDMHMKTPPRFGPEIGFHYVFPAKGLYQIFSQFERRGKVVLTSFMVEAR